MREGNAVHFSPDKEIPHLEKAVDRPGGDGKGAGPSITEEQIAELKAHAEDINYEVARRQGEKRCAMML